MQTLLFPETLPSCNGIHPAFKNRFSGWQLGMGLPETLNGLLHGLGQLADEDVCCLSTAIGMSLWGAQAYPLAPHMLQWALSMAPKGLRLDPALAGLAVAYVQCPSLDESDVQRIDEWYALVRQDEWSLVLRFLVNTLGHPQKGMAWLAHCWQDLLHFGRPELPKAALDMVVWGEGLEPLKARMEAEWALHYLPPQEALEQVERVSADTWGLWRAYVGSELLRRLGRVAEAKGVLAAVWKAIPWHVNITLKLYDDFQPTPVADVSDTEEVAILVYSWNKADLLADTLDSLAASDIGNARVFALNNGSTDHTAQVLEEAQHRLGADRFHIETLPINVGAPAARNWLLALPQVRASKWAAFLDDDIVLPQSWLLHLLGAAKGRDHVGAVGCRITAASSPFGLQSADYNLFPVAPAEVEPGKLPNRVLVFDNCAGSLDMGLFAYTRPCLSVSGCCHMISMHAVEQAGGFDLRYTPSQFDDLDRDLRSGLAGLPAVYAGDLAVRHVQHSSLAKSQTTRQIGHVLGNKFKLDTKYTDEELIALGTANRNQLWNDLEMKYAFVLDRLGQGA